MIKASREINDVDDFNCYADDALTYFCEILVADGHTRPVTENDGFDDTVGFVYTDKACKWVNRYIDLLYKAGSNHFDSRDIDISSYMYQEY